MINAPDTILQNSIEMGCSAPSCHHLFRSCRPSLLHKGLIQSSRPAVGTSFRILALISVPISRPGPFVAWETFSAARSDIRTDQLLSLRELIVVVDSTIEIMLRTIVSSAGLFVPSKLCGDLARRTALILLLTSSAVSSRTR